LIALVLLAIGMRAAGGAAVVDCVIVEGSGIGPVRIGMPLAAALAITGPPLLQRGAGSQIVYTLRPPWAQIVAEYGTVVRVGVRGPECRTSRGIGAGTTLTAVRAAYASATASLLTETQDGGVLTYPFNGIAFVLRAGRVESVEVLRPEGQTAGRPAPTPGLATSPPSPITASPPAGAPASPTARGTWGVRSSTARIEGSSLVVSGAVENRSRAQSAYADIRVFNGTGRQVASGDSPLYPNPVPGGSTATFEVRLSIAEVVRRYTVTIRPLNSITESLAEQSGDIKDVQGFASIVARQVTLAVQTKTNPPTRDDFMLLVTNGSPLNVETMTVLLDFTATCHVRIPAPVRPFREVLSARVTVEQVRAGATASAAIQLPQGPCYQFETWYAQPHVTDIRVSD
jgi:hypothetical protein